MLLLCSQAATEDVVHGGKDVADADRKDKTRHAGLKTTTEKDRAAFIFLGAV